MGTRIEVAGEHARCGDNASDHQGTGAREPLEHGIASENRLPSQVLSPGVGVLRCG